MADATVTVGQLLDWTTLDDTISDTPGLDSGTLDLGDGVTDATIYVTVCHKDTNAAATNIVTVKIFVRPGGTADEDWRLLTLCSAGGGTAVKEDIVAQSASGQSHIEVADTTDWDTGLGERLFILDATLANSELVTIIGWIDIDYYLAADNLVNTHENTADLLDGVNEIPVAIPDGCRYCKVVFANSDDDANYAVRIDYSAVTDYE